MKPEKFTPRWLNAIVWFFQSKHFTFLIRLLFAAFFTAVLVVVFQLGWWGCVPGLIYTYVVFRMYVENHGSAEDKDRL